MADPFQDVDAAGEEFIAAFADSMDARQSDPKMESIVASYLSKLKFAEGSLTVEVGAGAGAVTRRIAAKAEPEQVMAFEPSSGFVRVARERAKQHTNVTFEVADGTALPLDDHSVFNLIMHTVLTHVVDPVPLLQEARRVLKSDGCLVVCDADFSKASLSNSANDPLDACARAFVNEFVTDPHIVAKMRSLMTATDFEVTDFDVQSRTIADNEQMLPWVEETSKRMLERGEIGEELFCGLVAEYKRRAAAGTLYGHQVFATAIAKPS
ncbi:methyltransferase domain-containing protein [Tritonibacter scottomollicae]|uniref:Methyltransferase domain-containing protein n=1 Tax=Tritonibacter scottomollicae TaxID=483013 RepID=A0ABZ0HH83_TRISK|nr:methyltransferase domain-containing protein [Tritonibacter scottomollicae]WOI33792.1 methyltransferase domain-containing protein [Tritonibacter scottomollicae]